MTPKVVNIPCLDVKDGRHRLARSGLAARTGKTCKIDAVRELQ